MSRMLAATALLALVAAAPARVAAWGDDGHRIVCGIAYLLLEPAAQDEVDRLTARYRRPDGVRYGQLPEACTFADVARSRARQQRRGWNHFTRFNRWHFLNVPRDTREVSEAHCGDDCVLKGIAYHAGRLGNRDLEDWKRAEALFFLGHWIADVHQPLHVSYEDDQGGNEITPILGRYYDAGTLHGVWDSGIVGKARGSTSWPAYATRLQQAITPAQRDAWRTATPLDWARESYALTTGEALDYCEWRPNGDATLCSPEPHTRTLGASYQRRFAGDVETRLQQAAVRLAEAIRRGLGR